jgi:hypothetical protein
VADAFETKFSESEAAASTRSCWRRRNTSGSTTTTCWRCSRCGC